MCGRHFSGSGPSSRTSWISRKIARTCRSRRGARGVVGTGDGPAVDADGTGTVGNTDVRSEHDMGGGMDISGRVGVVDDGKMIGDGTPDEGRRNQDVSDAYLGVVH